MKPLKLSIKTALVALVLQSFTPFGFAQQSEKDLISVIGTGDIMLGSNYPSEAKLPPRDGKELLRNVKDVLRDANVTFG
ncbi:MAG: hypothetical protein LBT04_04595, partial [Prevotellaceae bacterium]|nr:hypothetical protein [Prevotellaceae bacterium]